MAVSGMNVQICVTHNVPNPVIINRTGIKYRPRIPDAGCKWLARTFQFPYRDVKPRQGIFSRPGASYFQTRSEDYQWLKEC
jgi:hypothetical protein